MPKVNKAVEKQAQLAEEMYQKAYGKTDEPAPAKEETGNQEPQPTESQPVAAEQESAPQQTEEAQATEVKPVENATEKPKQKFPDADPNDPSWEQKYKVIANKYSAEVPRYAAEVRSLKAEIESLKQQMSTTQHPTQPAAGQISSEEVEEYGEKFVDFVKRAAREAVPGDVDGLKQSVEEVRKEQTKLATVRFFDELGALSPQWKSLNDDEEFLGFLADIDPYTGQQRQVLFDDAYAKLDAWRVANFFNAFAPRQQQPEPAPQKPSLEPQITPKVTGRTAPPPGKKIYNTAEVARFYDDMRRGRYSADEAARIESDIFAAQAEGRFR